MIQSATRRKEAAIIRALTSCLAAVGALALAVYVGWSTGGPAAGPQADLAAAMPTASGPKTLVIKTDRRGPHHVMRAVVTGPSGRPEGVSFLVDTGASFLMLPTSLMRPLGFDPAKLPTMRIQTANGVVPAKEGVLKSVELGGPDDREVIERVTAVFMDDSLIGGIGLMGMNVLGRYSVTIEDDADRIVLVRRH